MIRGFFHTRLWERYTIPSIRPEVNLIKIRSEGWNYCGALQGGSDTSYTWSSSFPSIATVDANGKVTGIAQGHVFIQALGNQSGAVGSIELSVVGENAIIFTAPAAGAAIAAGSAYSVKWQMIGTVGIGQLWLSKNGGVTYESIASGINCAALSYSWNVPSTALPLRQCTLKMTWNGGEATSGVFSIVATQIKTDFIGSWTSGIWARNSNSGQWTWVASGAFQVAAGDIDGDAIDDIVGIWPGSGIWAKYSSTDKWTFIGSEPSSIAVGDTSGDHKAEILGIWGSSVWSRDGSSGAWTNITTGALQIAVADMDGDGKADLTGIWPGGGIWVKYSLSGKWINISSGASTIACGDLNGDGKSDLVGIWGSSVWALDSATSKWTLLTSGASSLVTGDLDGDGKDDLIGTWPGSGVWVKYSSSGVWTMLTASIPDSMTTAKMR